MKNPANLLILLIMAQAIIGCTSADIEDLPSTSELSSSSAESLGAISSPSAKSSSSIANPSNDIISCLVGANCAELSQNACDLVGGIHVPYCPASSSSDSDAVSSNSGNNASSSSNAALPASSSSSIPNVLCIVGTGCLELPQNICASAGTQVSSCPAVPSSSSITTVVPSSSSIAPVVPSSSSRPSSSSNGGGFVKISFIDTRDGQTYSSVKIGSQTWMAENLNYNADGSKCYSNQDSYCNTYGRLYDWATAMDFSVSCNSTNCASQVNVKHRGICPSGWHIPNASDWDILMNYVQTDNGSTYNPDGSASIAGKYLKATSGWDNDGNGQDTYGFAALPSGYGHSSGTVTAGSQGYWWSTSEYGNTNAYRRYILSVMDSMSWLNYVKSYLYSVRCIKD
jgi:uncharacterized protein (TIGR02145 family)